MQKKGPKNQRTKRALAHRAPKLQENTKTALLIKGAKSSAITSAVLKDMYILKKPDAKMFSKRNFNRPFEDASSVEFLGSSNDASLFAFGGHTKKRPHNLILGRMFDFNLLDMLELGVDPKTFKSLAQFRKRKVSARQGSKPMFVFAGDEWESTEDLKSLRNVLLDFFRGAVVDKINLAGLDRVIVVTAIAGKVFFRHYGIMLRKSGTKFPRVELELVGPSIDFSLRRSKSAAPELRKEAMRTPRKKAGYKRKNIERNEMGDRMGRIHMSRQDLSELALSKMKGLKKKRKVPAGPTAPPAAAAAT